MKRWLIRIFIILIVLLTIVWLYTGALINVHPTTKGYLKALTQELIAQDYAPRIMVISGKRLQWHNDFLSQYGGAAKNSRHLKGEAIDIVVLDVNKDGTINTKDVDIVYKILNTKIVGNKGGVGTYKHQSGFFNRQQVHFDCRGHRARWHR